MSVTKSINKLEDECQSIPIDEMKVKKSAKELVCLKSRLVDLHLENEKYLENLMEGDPEDENVEAKVSEEMDKMNGYLERIESALVESEVILERVVSEKKENERFSEQRSSIRLPKIGLPTFSGDVLKWVEFIECFEAAVNQSEISDVEKFAYLKGQLSSEALQTISGLSLTHCNYNVAIDLLKERFGDSSVLIRAHIRKLLALESPSNTPDTLKSFLDKILVHTRSLESLGISKDSFDIFLSEIILSRISPKLKMQYSKLANKNQTLSELVEIIKSEVKGLDLVKSTDNSFDKHKHNENSFKHNSASSTKIHNKSISFGANYKQSNITCSICKNNSHRTQECSKLISCSNIDQRIDLIKRANVCFNCFGPHHIRMCQSAKKCQKCGSNHNTLLHKERVVRPTQVGTTVNVAFKGSVNSSILPVVPMQFVSCNSGMESCGALLDTGSHKSFISSELCSRVKHKVIQRQYLSISGFNNSKSEGYFDIVECYCRGSTANEEFKMNFVKFPELYQCPVQTTSNISFTLPSNDVASTCSEPIRVIIGCDNYYRVVTGELVYLKEDLCALKTKSGWILQGAMHSDCQSQCNLINIQSGDLPAMCLERFWTMELVDDNGPSAPDAINWFENNVSMVDGRYQVRFPWRNDRLMWSTYEDVALQRLKSVVKKLVSLKKLSDYDAIIKDYLSRGIAEKVESDSEETRTRVLPHHPVIKENSQTTKMRIVLDASAKSGKDDNSLNDCMIEGTNFLSNLLGILLRFRKGRYALTADIEKAFLQLSLHPEDRDAVRFWWYSENLDNTLPTSQPQLYRMSRLPFGVKASPFLLCAAIRHHLDSVSQRYPEVVDQLKQSLYMDDLIISTDNFSEAERIARESCSIFSLMQMNLRKWCTNFKINGQETERRAGKVFGIVWDIETDELVFNVKVPEIIETKRQLASVLCAIWDPFGYISPFT